MKARPPFALGAAVAWFLTATALPASETDDRIESSFSKSYAYRVYLKDAAIKAESRNGVVTLSGQVDEESHKHLAEEAVAGLPGVARVDNRLEVKLEGTEKSDNWIRAKVRSVLALHRNVSGSRTQVDIRDGVITLRGQATSEAQKELATEYAQDVQGVLRVTNVMTVAKAPAPPAATVAEAVDDASITAQVKVALRLHRSTSTVNTRVGTAGGVVTVGGVARNAAEKALVTKLAMDISGVQRVINNMALAPMGSPSDVRPAGARNLRLATTED
ncbi:MAG: BON domain-containing protein [Verrucomicrobiales bacterium]|nr:BON domain-containing protein [Verrucomicrobiales bacterium]